MNGSINLATQYVATGSFNCINWWQVGTQFGIGAVGGAVGSAALGSGARLFLGGHRVYYGYTFAPVYRATINAAATAGRNYAAVAGGAAQGFLGLFVPTSLGGFVPR